MRIEKIVAKALKNLNDDRYLLSVIVAKRSEAFSNDEEPLIDITQYENSKKLKPTDIALLEVAEGKISFDLLNQEKVF
jgi:DNA-directed RNA polymerase subunit omega